MSKKGQRHKDLTSTFLSGGLDEDRLHAKQRFSRRAKHHQKNKTARTALLRAAEADGRGDLEALPSGRVVQVHSVHIEVEHDNTRYLCVVRKTIASTSRSRVVVGDFVRFSTVEPAGDLPLKAANGEGVIERIEPRVTILTRADTERDRTVGVIPIIANAQQMLIVVSLLLPRPKWGLVDRMIVAAQSGGLRPVICLNKLDLSDGGDARISPNQAQQALVEASEALAHYQKLGVATLPTSASTRQGIEPLAALLKDRMTVLAGHSGVGKSSLIQTLEPGLDIRVGAISNYNQKGRHTTSSARIYELSGGGSVVDTPGVKLFGLVNVTADSLIEHFPDVADGSAPSWRRDSFERISESL